MGLLKCPDCGKDISERAITCIHCGCPIREWITEQKAAEEAAGAARKADRLGNTPDEAHGPIAEKEPGDPRQHAGRANRRMKILAVIGVLIVAGVGIFYAIKSLIRPDYYQEGMKVVSCLNDMLKSDEFEAIIGVDDHISTIRKEFMSYDFSSPIAVYSIRITDMEKFVRFELLSEGPGTAGKWNSLPPSLKEAVMNRCPVSTMAMKYNAKYSSEMYAFSSLYLSVSRTDRLNNGVIIDYLYIYGNNSILVSFEKGIATGRILFAGSEQIRSAADVKEIFGDSGLEIKQVK